MQYSKYEKETIAYLSYGEAVGYNVVPFILGVHLTQVGDRKS